MPESKVIYLHAITPLHAGAGTAMGAIDMPVQRERHTGWPLIPSSSIKGVFRANWADRNQLARLFGSEDQKQLSAGALAFTDARLLAFPVRSLIGTFAWVTCPMVLQRWQRDSQLAGTKLDLPALPPIADGKGLTAPGCHCVHNMRVVLEEFNLAQVEHAGTGLPGVLTEDERKRLVVVSDDQFTYFAQYATEVVARIGLDDGSKTAKDGALFYQELVPAETIFYSVVSASPSRIASDPKGAGRIWRISGLRPICSSAATRRSEGGCAMSVPDGLNVQTLSQQRAKDAWEVAKKFQGDKDFQMHAKRMPMRIRNAGLGQTAAYMKAKGEGIAVYQAVEAWLRTQKLCQTDVLTDFRQNNAKAIRLMTAEALAYLEWLVRFADAGKVK